MLKPVSSDAFATTHSVTFDSSELVHIIERPPVQAGRRGRGRHLTARVGVGFVPGGVLPPHTP